MEREKFRDFIKYYIEELSWWQRLPVIRNYYLMWCYLEALEQAVIELEEKNAKSKALPNLFRVQKMWKVS